MSTDPNKSAQEERAKRLRDQIAKIKQPDGKDATGESTPGSQNAGSPHEFVERRMQEIAEQKKKRPPLRDDQDK